MGDTGFNCSQEVRYPPIAQDFVEPNLQMSTQPSSGQVHESAGLGLLVLESGKTMTILSSEPVVNPNIPQPVQQIVPPSYMPYSGLINAKVTPHDGNCRDEETVIFRHIKVDTEWKEEEKKRRDVEEHNQKKRQRRDAVMQVLLQGLRALMNQRFPIFAFSKSLRKRKAKRSHEKSPSFLKQPIDS